MTAYHERPTNKQGQHSQLKCLVLGSAGAGKTSLLRRYNYGTFEGHRPRNDFDDVFTRSDTMTNNNNHHWKTGRRNPTSTLGADYYVKKIDNPLYIKDSAPGNSRNETSSSLFVQLWDTAGKERLMPQRYPAQYDKKSNFYQFLSIRLSPDTSNNNSNNYEHRYNNWGGTTTNASNTETSMDRHHENEQRSRVMRRNNNTRQKHGHPLHYHRHNNKISYSNEPREDALYRNVDACMLVYDSTSSVSFLHLMQLHSEWVQRLNRWEIEDEIEKNDRPTQIHNATGSRRRKHIPFIVVANKIDLLEKSELLRSSGVRPQRRSVMGFNDGESYKGKDLVYEFAVENTNEQLLDDHSSFLKRRSSNNNRLTYSLKETSWSNDRIYLRALQLTEDQLPANRLLILLWCQRNGIPHFEASALDGRGVNDSMEHLILVGAEELQRREEADKPADTRRHDTRKVNYEHSAGSTSPAMTSGVDGTDDTGVALPVTESGIDPSQYYFLYQPTQNEPLDLFARYSAKRNKVPSCFSKCC